MVNAHKKRSIQWRSVLLILYILLDVYQFCRSKFIHMVFFLAYPHTSDYLQPLDVTSFDVFYKRISQCELAELFNRAILKVVTMEKGLSNFTAAGIDPLNLGTYTEDDIAVK